MQRKQNGITTIINWKYSILVLTLAALLLSGCKSRAVEEAREVIAVADSLRAEGQGYTDSVVIAEAYNTLDKWQYLYPTDYAHACYHYGRLLRNNDDPVSAMEVFINGTHSRTKDYHILGRIYSNMGSISHLAGEYQLAYDMYSRSADMFLKNADTLLYYYGLNEMAFELVRMDSISKASFLLTLIGENCDDVSLHQSIAKTKILILKHSHQYDSLIEYANTLSSYDGIESFVTLSKAHAFYYLQEYDSALLYAKKTLNLSNSIYEMDNAYYVFIHCDSIHGGSNVYQLTSNRADLEKIIEQRHGKLSQATQLLTQDINRKPIWPWLIGIAGFLLMIMLSVSVTFYKKKNKHQLLSQQILNLEQTIAASKAERLQAIENKCSLLSSSHNINEDLGWKSYDTMCDIVNKHFNMLARKLQKAGLTEKEVRICVLTLLNYGYDEMADILFYASNGIGKFKIRTAKKIGTTAKNLRDYLINMTIQD